MRQQQGFGLVEVMIAMVLGLVVVLGVSQIFISSKQSFLTQDASAKLQEDARYILSRMTQELRMAGLMGCVAPASITNYDPAFDDPITWDGTTLSVITSSPVSGKESSSATWTVVTNCSEARVETGAVTPTAGEGEIALPIRQVEYQYDANSDTLKVREGGSGSFQPLIGGVSSFNVTFGLASGIDQDYVDGDYSDTAPNGALIRSVRISLTLSDADGRSADQTYAVVAALRNRLP
jgi:type IV pilus assembly protein PilW